MSTNTPGGPKPPGAARTAGDDDDPWNSTARLQRLANEALDGGPGQALDLGDTSQLIRSAEPSIEVAETPSTELLKFVTDSLAVAPERADLWMMRFEILKTLGMRAEFAEALQGGWTRPDIRKQLDWPILGALWSELAPGEPAPHGIRFPELAPVAQAGAGRSRERRFSDLAQQIAGPKLEALAGAYQAVRATPGFLEDFARKTTQLLRRPTPLVLAGKLSRRCGTGVRIFLKREDRRTVSRELENAAVQAYTASRLGSRALIASDELDAHALALAHVAPAFSLECVVVTRDPAAQQRQLFVQRLRELGARVVPAPAGAKDGEDPRLAALRLWLDANGPAHLALSAREGPAPFPLIAADFQSLLGRETELQYRAAAGAGRRRTTVASVNSEADSIGFMLPLLSRPEVELVYAEPEPGGAAAWRPSRRLRAYGGATREHLRLRALGRIDYVPVPDHEALSFQRDVAALEDAHISLEDARAVAVTALLGRRDEAERDFVVLTS